MPYIITTTPKYDPMADTHAERIGQTNRAVATLDEARERLNVTAGLAESEQAGAAAALFAQIDALSSEGGKIGPLPDGTVIEIQQVGWVWLWTEARKRTPTLVSTASHQETIDAYNAPQRLEYLRACLRDESISWGELAELQDLSEYIAPDDVELREAAGLPEFPEEEEYA